MGRVLCPVHGPTIGVLVAPVLSTIIEAGRSVGRDDVRTVRIDLGMRTDDGWAMRMWSDTRSAEEAGVPTDRPMSLKEAELHEDYLRSFDLICSSCFSAWCEVSKIEAREIENTEGY